MIAFGSNEISKVCLGSNELSKVCLGATEIYSSGSPLPYDAEIEFIQSDGTQWIDTGITTDSGILMEYYGAMAGNKASPIVGIWKAAPERFGIYKYNTYNISAWKNSTSKYIRVSTKDNTFYNVSFDTRGTSFIVKWNGEVKENSTTSGTFSSTSSIKVFYDDYGSSVVPGKIRTLKLTDSNGDVVLDWKAVRVGQVGYMYDSITGTLHGNDGEDNFIIGSDL